MPRPLPLTFAASIGSRVECARPTRTMNALPSPLKPLIRAPRDASTAMIQRAELLAKPCEFFKSFFGGRIPTVEEKLFWIERAVVHSTTLHVYYNDLYMIEVGNEPPFIRLSITRHDRQACKEWKHLQEIKNRLIGPEHEAVELFPAESRLIDTTNQYHMWVHADPNYRFPIGWKQQRFVLDEPLAVHHLSLDSLPIAGEAAPATTQAA